MNKKSFWGLYIISFFDFLVSGLVILIMIMPVIFSFDDFFGESAPIFAFFLYYIIWGAIGFVCFLAGWKTLRFKPDIRFANIFISILILIFAYCFSEFARIREIETIKGINPTWIFRLIYFYVLWSICYILRPKLNAKLKAYNQPAEADVN